ncbi:hypothetical protein V496_04582 [Pseudogymnoascus sp. VKM F-4515 (FW-2607)]|nr:hypothetical protein V496_04582 [Pseudogymnoascus sp. VKM F-4515 (FW-2607)]KFY91788.1 hypothetical protein V498_05319 [Pseudogymnoascus sp. VKM F-4517 (FW-2822)]
MAERLKIAVIGSGMAGLAAAWALHNDPSGKFAVTVLEKGNACALDGYSYSPPGATSSRIDIPMRVFSGEYYANLFKLVAEFNVPAKPRRFLFVFTREEHERPYFIHASNKHKIFPPNPEPNPSLYQKIRHLLLSLTLALCYTVFSFGVRFFPPEVSKPGQETTKTETIENYCKRLFLPQFFLNDYLVPLFSSVATCSHDDFRNFPAIYISDYKKYTSGNDHNSVTTMQAMQEKLISNNLQIKLRHPVTNIESQSDGTVKCTIVDLDNGKKESIESFDKVITATSSHALAHLYKPARPMASQLPICEAEVVVHTDYTIMSHVISRKGPLAKKPLSELTAAEFLASTQWLNPDSSTADILALQTRRSPSGEEWTEATHVHSSGILVTVRPVIYSKNPRPAESVYGSMNKTPRLPPSYLIAEDKVAHKAVFYRMLSNPYRRELIRKAFSKKASEDTGKTATEREGLLNGAAKAQEWRNGDGGVYATGSWPCDSLTLLENCVRTALTVAGTLGAELPFEVVERTEF